jgi:hypothetical protein
VTRNNGDKKEFIKIGFLKSGCITPDVKEDFARYRFRIFGCVGKLFRHCLNQITVIFNTVFDSSFVPLRDSLENG